MTTLSLTDEQSHNNQHDADPFNQRQVFTEEQNHPKGCEYRANIIEGIRLRHTYFSQRKTE